MHKRIGCTILLWVMVATNIFSQEKTRDNGFSIYVGPRIHFGFNNDTVITNPYTNVKYDLSKNVHYTKRTVTPWLEIGAGWRDKFYLQAGYALPEKGTELVGKPLFISTNIAYEIKKGYIDLGARLFTWKDKNSLVAAVNWLYIDHRNETVYHLVMQPRVEHWEIDYHARAHNVGIKLMYRKQFRHTQLDLYVVQPLLTVAVIDYKYLDHKETSPTQGTDFYEEKNGYTSSFFPSPSIRNVLQFGIGFSYLLGIK